MRNIYLWTTCMVLLSPLPMNAQNAYYDAIRLHQFIENKDWDKAVPVLLRYGGKGTGFPWGKFTKKYPDHIGIIKERNDILNRVAMEQLVENELRFTEQLANLEIISPEANELQSAAKMYYTYKKSYDTLERMQNYILQQSEREGGLRLEDLQDAFRTANASAIFDSLAQEATSENEILLDTNVNIKTKTVHRYMDYIRSKKEESADHLEELLTQMSQLLSMPSIYEAIYNKSNATQVAQEQILREHLRTETADAEKAIKQSEENKSNGFRVPSQTEMIDALAIYLARRVKQEVSLHFIEKFASYLRDQSMMTTLFPSTLQLLNNRDAFTLPKFGTSWHLALSEDFVHIPENMIRCIPERHQQVKDYLGDGVRIGRLVQHHYSFTEAVNTLYENPLQVPALRHSNALIYLVNHELYNKEQTGNYWIRAEQIQQLKKEELEWMYVLLDVRYGDTLKKIMHKNWLGREIWNEAYFTKKVIPFKNWMSSILVQLNHFEGEIKKDRSNNESTALQGYWKFQNDLMEAVLDTNFMQVSPNAFKMLAFTKGIFSMYSAIDNKKYTLVVEEALKLLSHLEIDKQAKLQDILFSTHFNKALLQKKDGIQKEIVKHLDALNTNYELLNRSNAYQELEEKFTNLKYLLQEKGRGDALQFKGDQKEFGKAAIRLLNDHNTAIDSFLLHERYLQELQNDKSRNSNIRKVQYAIKNRWNDIRFLHEIKEESLFHFDSLSVLLRMHGLQSKKYFRIAPSKVNCFVRCKLFNYQTDIYANFLKQTEGRKQYQRIRSAMSFMSDILQTTDSRQLSNVIEAYSLPPSSYKLKRLNRFTINIDALAGAYAGLEYIHKSSNKASMVVAGGLAAPIGVSLSWGKRTSFNTSKENLLKENEIGFMNKRSHFKKMKGSNYSLHFNFLDLAAPISYRITNTADGGLPKEAKWSQLFSPGILGIIGIKGMPIALGTGLRFTPKLRTIEGDLQKNALRFDVGIYFDLPLLNIYYK